MVRLELDQETLDIIHELLLRGLATTDSVGLAHGAAYDEFVEEAGYPLRIGDQPQRVRDTWSEILTGATGETK